MKAVDNTADAWQMIGNEKLQCFCGDREELLVPTLRAIEMQSSSLPMELS